MTDSYTRPAVTVAITTAEKMLALRALRTINARHRIRRYLDNTPLWAFEADALADWLDQAAAKARPLSRTRRQAHKLAVRYRNAAYTARTSPIVPAEWPEAPRTHPIPVDTLAEQTAAARWAAVPPSPPEAAL